MNPRPREDQCQQTIVEAAHLTGWLIHAERPAQVREDEAGKKKWVTPIQGHKGFPDLVLVRPPEIMFIELKRKPNRETPEQREWIVALSKCGLYAAVHYVPEDLDRIMELLQ